MKHIFYLIAFIISTSAFAQIRDTLNIANHCKNSYTFYGQTYTNSGTYHDTVRSSNGTDSIIHTLIITFQNYKDTTYVFTCKAYHYKGVVYHSSTQILDTINSTCDTIRTISITISKFSKTRNLYACSSVSFNGKLYTASGTYQDSTTGSCDTLYTINVNILPQIQVIKYDTVYDSVRYNGVKYTISQPVYSYLKTADSCDSVVITYLTVKTRKFLQEFVPGCIIANYGSKTYTQSGIYYDTIISGEIDTISKLTVLIGKPYYDSITSTACNSYKFRDSIFYSSGRYRYNFPTVSGCDSTVFLNLTIKPVGSQITNSGIIFTASEPDTVGVKYQWYTCVPFKPISNATKRTITTNSRTGVIVVVSNGNCTDTSECLNVYSSSIIDSDLQAASIYPNPASSYLNIDFGSLWSKVNIQIFDLYGKLVFTANVSNATKFSENIDHLNSGHYIVKLEADGYTRSMKLIKD